MFSEKDGLNPTNNSPVDIKNDEKTLIPESGKKYLEDFCRMIANRIARPQGSTSSEVNDLRGTSMPAHLALNMTAGTEALKSIEGDMRYYGKNKIIKRICKSK